MKKLLTVLAGLALVVSLSACTKEVEKIVEVPVETIVEVEVEAALVEIPSEVTMSNIDTLVQRPNVQMVDLRNLDERMKSGYIDGFMNVPFFDYLENNALVKADGDWVYASEDLLDADILYNIFDEDADGIFLMCGSGTRAGYVMAALEDLGYDNVYNVGGFANYSGDNYVYGDGVYVDKFLPEEITMANVDAYLGLDGVQYVDLRNFSDKYSSGYIAGFENISFFQYLEGEGYLVRQDGDWVFATEDIVDAEILYNFFDEDARAILLMCGSGTRAGYVKAALEELGYDNVYNIGGYTSYAGSNQVLGDGAFVFPKA